MKLFNLISFVTLSLCVSSYSFAVQVDLSSYCDGTVLEKTKVEAITVSTKGGNYLAEFSELKGFDFSLPLKTIEAEWVKDSLLHDDELNVCFNASKEILAIEIHKQ
ncbi:TPA: hypothetical protein ACX6Q1_001076 [Photobacterium damselae]